MHHLTKISVSITGFILSFVASAHAQSGNSVNDIDPGQLALRYLSEGGYLPPQEEDPEQPPENTSKTKEKAADRAHLFADEEYLQAKTDLRKRLRAQGLDIEDEDKKTYIEQRTQLKQDFFEFKGNDNNDNQPQTFEQFRQVRQKQRDSNPEEKVNEKPRHFANSVAHYAIEGKPGKFSFREALRSHFHNTIGGRALSAMRRAWER